MIISSVEADACMSLMIPGQEYRNTDTAPVFAVCDHIRRMPEDRAVRRALMVSIHYTDSSLLMDCQTIPFYNV